MDQENLKIITTIAENLLNKLDIKGTIISSLDDQNVVNLKIETEESGILIGYHGETLYSLQLIISLMVFRKLGAWTRLVLDVGDYRKRREAQLVLMAKNLAQRVKQTGQPVTMPYLTSGERRSVHLALTDEQDVVSKSEGEGDNRCLIIKSRNTPQLETPDDAK